MSITNPVYCVREDIKLALDVPETVRDNALVDSAVMAAADDIYGLLHRRFYPEDAVKYFDWLPGPTTSTRIRGGSGSTSTTWWSPPWSPAAVRQSR